MQIEPSHPDEEVVIEKLRDDPEFVAGYLNALLEDGDQEDLMLAMRRMAKAYSGVPQLAEQAEHNAELLYRMLSTKGNPELRNLHALLKAMGKRLVVQPIARQA